VGTCWSIAWRLAHISILVLGLRVSAHFDEACQRWVVGVTSWGRRGMEEECGAAEGPWARHPRATLVLHINREVIHHGAEIATLRDLYRASDAATLA
jgi:hypothetical protein